MLGIMEKVNKTVMGFYIIYYINLTSSLYFFYLQAWNKINNH